MRQLLVAALLGTAFGQSCTIPKKEDTQCKGDDPQTVKGKTADECCALCAEDSTCVQWSHQPGWLIFSSTCYLNTDQSTPSSSSGKTCGQKNVPPAPPPPPPSPPIPPAKGAEHHWAVIMAGSNTFSNYRHQADACHAYQIAKKNGIPEDQIILLAYDDIANNRQNKFKGKIYNKPNGPDVYAGCKINYKGKNVNKANFLKVLTGDTSAPGPVLKSTSESRVFVYFADHGGVGILGVPEGAAGGYIHAKEVNAALETLNKKGGYKELLFYIEACESGSIFKGLLKAPNVFAVTAANAKESSWGFYCPPLDKVNGKHVGSCLGDEFSIRWMEDSDAANFKSETVMSQVTKVTKLVKKSHVQKFGDSSAIGKEVLGDFEGADGDPSMAMNISSPLHSENNELWEASAVNSRDIEVHLAYYAMQRAETLEEKRTKQSDLTDLLKARILKDQQFMLIAMEVTKDNAKAQEMIDADIESLENVDCHYQALSHYVDMCGSFDDYTMRYSRLFANLCKANVEEETIRSAIQNVCKKPEVVI